MRRQAYLTVAALALAAAPAAAQQRPLAARVAAVRNGMAEFRFPSRSGVCGDGHSFIRVGEHNTVGNLSEGMFDRPCIAGPVRIVLNLAIDHAAEFRALIGLEAADFQAPWYDTTWLNRPDIHGGEVCAALVSGLIAPQSPDISRTETLWAYKQGGPGVFKGDLYFYRVDGDLRGRVEKIDTKVCPLFLLTGEYDFSCTPEDTRRTAAAIGGASVTIMEQLGHFPMSENPGQFRRYISPVLGEILKQSKQTKQGVNV